jgi:hypothetical protein
MKLRFEKVVTPAEAGVQFSVLSAFIPGLTIKPDDPKSKI